MRRVIDVVYHEKARQTGPLCAYLYDLGALADHVRRLVDRLPPYCRLYYAVKANSEGPILAALAPLVHGFEVASLGEIGKVRAAAPDAPVVFGGPGKTDEELDGALLHGVQHIHVESLHELRRLDAIAARRGARVPVLLRVNLRGPLPSATLAMAGRPTQFGIDEAQVPDAVALARSLPHVELRGFHFHSISNHLDPVGHARLVADYVARAAAWAERLGLSVSVLNAGGGIGVDYARPDRTFDWDAFVRALDEALRGRLPRGWTLLFECGRFLVAACGYYAVEVLDVKENHGTAFAVVRGGTHHFRLPASWQHSHPFCVLPVEAWPYAFPRPEVAGRTVTVVGQLCTPKDVLARNVPVPRLRAGDILLFRLAGAYGWSISHHDFLSHPHPVHLFLLPDGRLARS